MLAVSVGIILAAVVVVVAVTAVSVAQVVVAEVVTVVHIHGSTDDTQHQALLKNSVMCLTEI